MGPITQQAKIAAHAEQKQRHRKDKADDEAALLVFDFGFAGGGFGIFQGVIGTSPVACRDHIITSLAHGGDQIAACGCAGSITHHGFFISVIDFGGEHAIYFVQAALDGVGAVGAGHAQEREFGNGRGHFIPCLLNTRNHLRGHILRLHQRRVVGKRHLFAGVVHRRPGDAFHFLGAAFHRRHTVGAGHAHNGQSKLLLFGHRSSVRKNGWPAAAEILPGQPTISTAN